jgi:hypothetical protein
MPIRISSASEGGGKKHRKMQRQAFSPHEGNRFHNGDKD